jgi:hypothetical protein
MSYLLPLLGIELIVRELPASKCTKEKTTNKSESESERENEREGVCERER